MKVPAGNQRRVLLGAVAVVVSTMAGVLLLTAWPDSKDDDSRDPGMIPPPEAEGGSIEVPADLTPPPEVTPPPPTHIEIRGQQVPLTLGMTYGASPSRAADVLDPDPYGRLWRITYDPDPAADEPVSWLDFDDKFTLVASQIRLKDRKVFEPLFRALDLPHDDFDKPPTHITIRDREVPLAPAMTYVQLGPGVGCYEPCRNPSKMAWQIVYDLSPDDALESWLIFDESYNVLESRILDEDRELFEPLLDAFDPPYDIFASPPAYIFIRDQQVPLAPGMTISSGGVTVCEGAPCPEGEFTRVRYDSKPEEAGWSWLVFDEGYTLRGSQIRPEDQDEFQPIIDAFSPP